MPSDCVFELNKPTATYLSGEIITGTITLTTTSDKNVREVCIIFLGKGKVSWSESHSAGSSNDNTNRSIVYESHETYIDNSSRVYDDGVLPAGTYRFTFNIPLPLECPTSCKGEYGHVRYELSLKINRYYRFDNIFKKPITIIKTMDLNLEPVYKLPTVLEDVDSMCCCSCSNGTIFCTLKVPFGAYTSGQAVTYTLEIANQTMDDIQGYTLTFYQKMIFHARTPHSQYRHTTQVLLTKDFTDKCLRLTNKMLEGEFIIPDVPTTTDTTSIICIEYYFEIVLSIPLCGPYIAFTVPLVIGTIPIRESLATNQVSVMNEQQPLLQPSAPEISAPEIQAADDNLSPSYSGLMPPTFEEAMHSNSPFVATDIEERNRTIGFRPLNPVYNISNAPK